MSKKFLCFGIIFILSFIFFFNICYATDLSRSLSNSLTNTTIDNTIYSANQNDNQSVSNNDGVSPISSRDFSQSVTTTTSDYQDEGELSIGNMINIILIVVGVVLVFLGIAIIIKLK